MSSITLYADEECTLIAASGMVGAYKQIYGSSPIITTQNRDIVFDEQTVKVWHICNYYASTVERVDATTIPLNHTDSNVYQYFYITPVFRIGYKYTGSLHNYTVGAMKFEYNQSGNWILWGNTSDFLGGVYDVVGIQFRSGEVAKQNIYGTVLQIDSDNWLGIDLLLTTNQGALEVRRCSVAISKVEYFFDTAEVKPYKPNRGSKRRGGTGTGYYPNSTIPALPTASINTFFSSILGRGNGLTYYKLTDDSLNDLCEYLYDCSPSLKFRSSTYRDAIASVVAIPYSVPTQVSNTLGLVYLAEKSIAVSGGCDIVTSPLVEINFGEINLTEERIGYRNFADFIHTSAVLYLPCIGNINIDMSSFVGGILSLHGVIDVRTGNILYRLESRAEYDDVPVLYGHYNGNCGIPIPIGGANNGVSILGAISSIGTIGVGVATGNPLNIVGGVASLANQTMPTIDTAGAMHPNTAAMGTPVPVLQIRKHIMSAPDEYYELNGIPSDGTRDGVYEEGFADLENYSGYFKARDCKIEDLPYASDREKSEIIALLKGGVFL